MAHKINEILNKAWGREPKPCTEKCKYWKYPHLETVCVLSEVFSVLKGEMCYELVEEEECG